MRAPVYACFVDFAKASDSVNHNLLWTKIVSMGLSAKMLSCVLASFQFELQVEHIEGARNVAADALSRGSLQVFQLGNPTTNPRPVTIPPVLEQMLIQNSPDWLSQSWRMMLTAICRWEWPRTQLRSTEQHRKGT